MSPETETKENVKFQAGVKNYKLTYYTRDESTKPMTPIDSIPSNSSDGGVPPKGEATIATKSSTGTWTIVWINGLTSLDCYKGLCYHIKPIVGKENQYIAYIAYLLDLF